MDEQLKDESVRLARSWMQHQAGWLRGYLVAGVEDPRINVQSILSRHFLSNSLAGESFAGLREHEMRFAAIMNWLVPIVKQRVAAEELDAILFGLRKGVEDVEGTVIPAWAARIYASLPATVDGIVIPNYIEDFLAGAVHEKGNAPPDASLEPLRGDSTLGIFARAWSGALEGSSKGMPAGDATASRSRVSVLEPACGSANDYRAFATYGLAKLIDYTGFDLCPTNIENARALFPSVRFEPGNVFEIEAADAFYELCIVHDLFEHLSIAGLERAVSEVCRVTRRGLCVHFFQMDEIASHVVRPVDEYHWNLLSMSLVRELFAQQGFGGQVLHIGSFLRQTTGCDRTHNPNAYTFLLQRSGGGGEMPRVAIAEGMENS